MGHGIRRLRAHRLVGPVVRNFHALFWNMIAGIIIARMLDPSDRGYVAIVVTSSGIAALLASLGVGTAYRAGIYRDGRINSGNYAVAVHGLAVIVCIPLLLGGVLVVSNLIDPRSGGFVGALLLIANGLTSYYRQTYTEELLAHGYVDRVASITVHGSVALAALVAVAWLVDAPAGAEISLAAYTLSAVYRAFLTRRQLRPLRRHTTWSWSGVGLLLNRGWRLAGFTFGQELTFRVDRFAVGLLGGTGAAGFYTVATTPAEVLRVPVTIAGHYVMHDHAEARRSGRRTLTTGIVAGVSVGALTPIAWLVAEPLITLVYGESYREAAAVFVILVAAQAFLSPYLVWSRALAGAGAQWSVSVAGIGGVVSVVLLCIFLVPPYGATGAGAAVMCTYAAMSLWTGLSLVKRAKE